MLLTVWPGVVAVRHHHLDAVGCDIDAFNAGETRAEHEEEEEEHEDEHEVSAALKLHGVLLLWVRVSVA